MAIKSGFSPEFMQELKDKNNIVEVASQYMSLDRRGYNYWACCPFHHEKTPSFSIQSIDQYYHCFGCGASGNVITLVMEMESVTFPEAVRILAARAKMPMPEMNYDNERVEELKRKKDRLLQITLKTARFYLSNLYSGQAEAHAEYIAKRELSPSTVKKFGMGASLDYDTLPTFLQDNGFTREEILDSGVCSLTDRGELIDAQANRLIIPIINSMDEVIAFGGRILGKKTDRVAKYKNTKETLLFNKRKTLYNINLLKKFKQNNAMPYVIMVEGYMDTISLYQAGFCNVVASMGTSLTQEQARMLKRFSDNVMISYDQDSAGQSADMRGLEILKDENLNVKVVLMPEGDDPDDVVRKYGADKYRECLENALPLVDYKLHAIGKKYDLTKTEDKRRYAQAVMPVIGEVSSAAEREDLLKKVRDETGFTYQSLSRDLEDFSATKPTERKQNIERTTAEKSDKVKKACRFILGAMLFRQPYAENYPLKEEDFSDEVHRTIARYILSCREKGQKIRATDLFDVFGENTAEFNEILDLNIDERLLGDGAEKYFADSVKTVDKDNLQRRINAVKQAVQEEKEISRRRALTEELTALTKDLKKYQ
jgi:DNA primase